MQTHKIKATILALAIVALLGSALMPAFETKIAHGQSLFDREIFKCDPAAPPENGGCGYKQFVLLINRFINWLIIIGFPLGAAFIAWGGFVILTSAGSAERVASGKKIITSTIVAMLIAGAAYFIIQGIFTVLGVQGEFKSQSIDQDLELPN
ncbi:MAG: pilin [bacterium]|nr:pilin [bacterium]